MKRIFNGILFILGAGFIIMNQMNYLVNFSLWESILIVLSSIIVLNCVFVKRSFFVLIPLSLLVIIFKEPLGIETISSWGIIVTAILLAIGLAIIFKKDNISCNNKGKDFKKETRDENNIDINVSMGSSVQYIQSEDLESVNISCKFAELNVFFNETNIKDKEVTVNLNVTLAGVELYIPKDWDVENNVSSNLAEMSEGNRTGKKTKKIILTGNVSLGGLKIIYI